LAPRREPSVLPDIFDLIVGIVTLFNIVAEVRHLLPDTLLANQSERDPIAVLLPPSIGLSHLTVQAGMNLDHATSSLLGSLASPYEYSAGKNNGKRKGEKDFALIIFLSDYWSNS
jgi:hypothetical protein